MTMLGRLLGESAVSIPVRSFSVRGLSKSLPNLLRKKRAAANAPPTKSDPLRKLRLDKCPFNLPILLPSKSVILDNNNPNFREKVYFTILSIINTRYNFINIKRLICVELNPAKD
jgi:hypothetical protein